MKRMNEVFELPVSDVELEIYRCFYKEGCEMADGEKAAAHAINNVDKLADALENLIPYCYGGNEEAMNAWAEAKDALAAYRGEK